MKAEADFQSSNKTGGINEAFNRVITVQEQALVGALKCLYWLCKERIAHTTKYQSLLDLAESLGCNYLHHLYVGENAKYKSERFLQEAVASLAML